MDFGLARMTEGRSKLTQSGTLMGTLDYMSPEQCQGEELDERTDIYSLGVVLYEILTGRVPFDAPNEASLMYKIVHEDPESIGNLQGDAPPALARVVEKAMQKHCRERYGGISALLAELGTIKAAANIPAENPSPSIAVLPFVNMSADPDQEYFCDGLAEEIINALTQIKDLHVVARTSAFFFKGKDVKIRDVGKELNVKTVLEGSVRKAGNRVRITAQLVNVVDGYHIWSERYDRELDDVFAIQDEITTTIVKKLRPKLLHEERPIIARRQTIDLEAYNLYLRGRYFWNKRTEEGQRKAFEYFKRAIAKDPGCALAYAGLADFYIMRMILFTLPPKESLPKVKEAALKALELDDNLAEAHVSLAYVRNYEWDWEGAEQEYRQAIELNPGCADAHCWYALHLMYMARFDEAIQEIEQARELDPLSVPINRYAGMIFLNSRRYDEAIEASKRAIEMEPDIPYVRLDLGLAYFGNSMVEEAMLELEKEKALSGRSNAAADTAIGVASALMGERGKAQKILDRLLEQSAEQYIPPFFCALLYFSLGENELGFEWLEKAYDEHDSYLSFLKVQPSLELLNLHSEPRYITMLKKIGLDK
ncbi:MAG: protein kinase, partial [Candidatus Hydrogenedentota bacterium]